MKKSFDIYLLITVLLLSIFGLMMVYSSSNIWSEYKFGDSFHFAKNQGLFFMIGIIIMILISKIKYTLYYNYSNIILLISIILLILVIIPGIGSVRNGSRSWFGIGQFGIQPSEAAKISLIIFTSKYFMKSKTLGQKKLKEILPILMISIVFFGLIMLQPDLGTATIMLTSILAIMFVAQTDIKFFIGGGMLGIIGIIALIAVAPYRMDRITSFIDPWKDALGTGFQIIQSLYAIGPGGLLGVGYLNSIQKHFYLPEPQTDFIFSIIAEEFGIMGVIIVVSLFGLLFYRCIKVSLNCNNLFGKYLSFGLSFQIIFQAIMNLMVVVGLIPVTGVTLPFLSYGGSSLLVSMASIGIILNISRNSS